jgi:hypothetical protein
MIRALHPGDNHMRGEPLADNGPSADDRAVAYVRALQDVGVVTYPNVIADTDVASWG